MKAAGDQRGTTLTKMRFRPWWRASPRSKKKVAIVVPLSSAAEVAPQEELSLRHLCHFLGKYDKYLVAPKGVTVSRTGFEVVHVPRKFFGSAAAHNRLLIWPRFYRAFEDYEFILMYHLDSLVFSDDLSRWCDSGWDYIGAPWLPCDDTPWVKEPRVGNGGFALMRVRSVLQVLHNRYRQKPSSYWIDALTRNGKRLQPLFRMLEALRTTFPQSVIINRPLQHWHLSENPAAHGRNNDYFWSFHASRFMPGFRVATVDDGLRFAFEAAPRVCFDLTNGQLPFGCHAWEKYDRRFWEPYLLDDETVMTDSTTRAVHGMGRRTATAPRHG